jgi:hypothetical protein
MAVSCIEAAFNLVAKSQWRMAEGWDIFWFDFIQTPII